MVPSVRKRRRLLTLLPVVLRLADGVRALVRDVAGAEGLTPAQAHALLFVARTKTFMTSIGKLADALRTSHVSAVNIAAELERRGLLGREQSPWDRRVTLLRLTPAGEGAVARLGALEQALEQAAAGLGVRSRESLEPALAAIVNAFQEAGVIAVAKPCLGCTHFVEDAAPGSPEPHRCRLVERFISEREALLDCPDHLPAMARATRSP